MATSQPEGQGQGEESKTEKGKQQDGAQGKPQQQTEEPKVKQVTFLDADDKDSHKGPKKERRKRTKRIMHQLKDQMEFYFGDSNLNKDRFMKEQTDKDPEGYVPISVFMNFSMIKKLTTSEEILLKALQFSDMLKVSEDGTRVRRTTPLKHMTEEEIDARTVYVEGFHKFISRDWIRGKFSKCGTVTYISLPRFKRTNEIKGYAFVEFKTPEQAETAVKMLNSIPDEIGQKPEEKVGASVKQSKNLMYWKKRASKDGIDPAELESSLKDSFKQEGEDEGPKEGGKTKSKKRKKKNRASLSQGEGLPTDSTVVQKADTTTTTAAAVTEESKENTVKQDPPMEGDESKVSDDSRAKKSKKAKKKRKRKAKMAEDASQNISDDASSAPESKDPQHKSATTETTVPGDCDKEPVNRKRPGSTEEASGPPPAKIPRVSTQPGTKTSKTEGESEGTEKPTAYDCTSLEGSKKVWEVCDAEPSTSSKKKKKEKAAREAVEQNRQSGSDEIRELSLEGEHLTKLPDMQKASTASKKRKPDASETPPEKTHKVKKPKDGSNKQGGGLPQRGVEQTLESATGEARKRKRKGVDGGEDTSSRKKKKGNSEGGSEGPSETEEEEGKKRRHRKHKPTKPDIRLRVMRKGMWTQLKRDYLEQQKVNMKKLKDQLKEASLKRREQILNKQNSGQDAVVGHPPPEFVPNVILEVKSEAELCLQTIKADIPPSVHVAYVDIRPGMTEGHIRCKDAESASKLLKTGVRGLTLSQVEGEAELQYWNKLINDRQARLSDTKRRKRRGKLKILQRAQNPHEESSQGQHIIFTEDDEAEARMKKLQDPKAMQDDFNAYSHRHPPTPVAVPSPDHYQNPIEYWMADVFGTN
ncbi:uncharacterized protein LOC143295302 [Babylonia areolata]|uniref:uncharacterized protein LOC143295302 n=1 Tax=Babylonia areolata TaxID=304850 RepID=UPI003FD2C03B